MDSAWWRPNQYAFTIAILLFHGFCYAEKPPNYSFMRHATEAPEISNYNYIIIGGGTAGCPLAATLSQNYSVLVLERGDSPYGNPNITDYDRFGYAFFDRSPNSPSQAFISEDGVINTRARALGGGTAINAGFYSRGEAEFVRDAGWDEKLVEESFRWVEEVLVYQPKVGPWQSALKDGLLEAGVVPDNGFTYDHLIGTKVGGTIFDENGHRHTAADLLQYANPNGISVLLHASVHKILFRTQIGSLTPIAYGVIFEDASGKKHTAYLKGPGDEIILSAGALGSPQLLMLSGIGPKEQLMAHNITLVMEQPLVGQGMADNPFTEVFVPSPIPVDLSLIQVVGITQFGSYIEEASGYNVARGTPEQYKGFDPRMGGRILQKINGPLSSGFLELRSSNPADTPSVTFNYFKEPKDLQKCVEGMKTILNVLQTKAFSKFMYSNLTTHDILNLTVGLPPNSGVKENTTASLPQFCMDTKRTLWHYHGGCQVGRVVDHDYKVLGVSSLRVVDGSTFLKSPGTNPQATVMMLGRYMGVKILNERHASDTGKLGFSVDLKFG